VHLELPALFCAVVADVGTMERQIARN
jgi:hypothetical protein